MGKTWSSWADRHQTENLSKFSDGPLIDVNRGKMVGSRFLSQNTNQSLDLLVKCTMDQLKWMANNVL